MLVNLAVKRVHLGCIHCEQKKMQEDRFLVCKMFVIFYFLQLLLWTEYSYCIIFPKTRFYSGFSKGFFFKTHLLMKH